MNKQGQSPIKRRQSRKSGLVMLPMAMPTVKLKVLRIPKQRMLKPQELSS